MSLQDKNILLVISGGIAAYKSLELIRLLRKSGATVQCILTKGGEHFIAPLSISALSGNQAYTDLWSLKDETEMGHIRLSREADLIIIAPASADLIAKMANGLADDLASTTLLAADKKILIAPAMNHQMWNNPATQRNIATLKSDGAQIIGPEEGTMACNETGLGRMSEPETIAAAITDFFLSTPRPLKGYTATITSGPTYEPLDPVRFIGNRSSGKQGHAIAAALAAAGAEITLITGPVTIPDPAGVTTIHVETAQEMLEATQNTLPTDIAICTAAVSDWRAADQQDHKIKKREGSAAPTLKLKENQDILRTISTHKKRPALLIGFAAETQDLLQNAKTKRTKKGCDWILANDVSPIKNIFGSEENHVYLITKDNNEQEWPRCSKTEVAQRLVQKIIQHLEQEKAKENHALNAAE